MEYEVWRALPFCGLFCTGLDGDHCGDVGPNWVLVYEKKLVKNICHLLYAGDAGAEKRSISRHRTEKEVIEHTVGGGSRRIRGGCRSCKNYNETGSML